MNKEVTKNEIKMISGTHFQGYIEATYDKLIVIFGEPYIPPLNDYKVDTEWIIDTPYGIATIYNYKDGVRYAGKNGTAIKDIRIWHIGSKSNRSYEWVCRQLVTD